MTYRAHPPNLLPVDRDTGGQAALAGWFDLASNTVATRDAFDVITVQPEAGIATSKVVGGLVDHPLVVQPGFTYTAAAEASRFGVIGLYWVTDDGQILPPQHGYGAGTITATGQAPDGAHRAIVSLYVPVARVVDEDDNTYTVSYVDLVDGGPLFFAADLDPVPGPVVFTHPRLVATAGDSGPMPPDLIDDSFGRFVYDDFPQIMRRDDATQVGLPLLNYMRGLGTPVDDALVVARRVYRGELLDPALADDAWIPYLAFLRGVEPGVNLAATRTAIMNRQTAPITTTTAALTAFVANYLEDTRSVDIYPSGTDWTLTVRVIADELGLVSDDPDVLRDLINASGQLPAGWVCEVITGQGTWQDVDDAAAAEGSTWTPGLPDTGRPWYEIDSIGVT